MLERSGYLSEADTIIKRIKTADEGKRMDLRTIVYEYDGLVRQQSVIETVRSLQDTKRIKFEKGRLIVVETEALTSKLPVDPTSPRLR